MSAKQNPPGTAYAPARAIGHVVEVWLDDQRYGFAVACVEQVLPMVWVSSLPEAPEIVIGVINLHGAVVPVLDIRRRLGLPARSWGPAAQLVMVRLSQGLIAVPVDEVVGVSERHLTTTFPSPMPQANDRCIQGIVDLADGLMYLCDIEAFLSLDDQHQLTSALERGRP